MLFQPIHVVRKTKECADIILNFLQNYRKLTDEEARSLLNSTSEWYGVVDGQQRLYAVIDLIQNVPNDWDSFLVQCSYIPRCSTIPSSFRRAFNSRSAGIRCSC